MLLDNPAGNAAAELRLRTAYLGWAQIEGLPALTHGTWLCLTLSAAIFDESVNAINFEGNKVSMDATRRLWGCILAGGFVSPPDGSNLGKLLKNVMEAAKRAPNQGDRIIRAADLDANEMAQIAGDPPLAVVNAPDDWDNRVDALRQHLTWGDLIRPDRSGGTIGMLEAAVVQRVLMTHRQPGSPYYNTLKAIARAAHTVEPLDDLANDEVALAAPRGWAGCPHSMPLARLRGPAHM